MIYIFVIMKHVQILIIPTHCEFFAWNAFVILLIRKEGIVLVIQWMQGNFAVYTKDNFVP